MADTCMTIKQVFVGELLTNTVSSH